MEALILNSGLWIRRLLSFFNCQWPASEDNDQGWPEKQGHYNMPLGSRMEKSAVGNCQYLSNIAHESISCILNTAKQCNGRDTRGGIVKPILGVLNCAYSGKLPNDLNSTH